MHVLRDTHCTLTVKSNNMKIRLYLILMILFLTFGCVEKNTESPDSAYKHWTGESPSNNIDVINGRYWQSSHWTLEYVVFLELKTDSSWIDALIRKTKFKQSEKPESLPYDKPDWFSPPKGYIVYVPKGFSQGSKFFVSPDRTRMFVYDIQL